MMMMNVWDWRWDIRETDCLMLSMLGNCIGFWRAPASTGQSGPDCLAWILGTFHEYSDQVIIYLVLIAETVLCHFLDWIEHP